MVESCSHCSASTKASVTRFVFADVLLSWKHLLNISVAVRICLPWTVQRISAWLVLLNFWLKSCPSAMYLYRCLQQCVESGCQRVSQTVSCLWRTSNSVHAGWTQQWTWEHCLVEKCLIIYAIAQSMLSPMAAARSRAARAARKVLDDCVRNKGHCLNDVLCIRTKSWKSCHMCRGWL